MNLTDVLDLVEGIACVNAVDWLEQQSVDSTVETLVDTCPYGSWLLWVVDMLQIPIKVPEAAWRPAMLRALRAHVPDEIPDLVSWEEARNIIEALPTDAPVLKRMLDAGLLECITLQQHPQRSAWLLLDDIEFMNKPDDPPQTANDVRAAMRTELIAALDNWWEVNKQRVLSA